MDATGFLEFFKRKGAMIPKKKLICLVVFVSLWASISHCSGGWLVYHKPEFKGKVIDAETKEPIEGAVVVVIYYKENFGGPGGGYTTVVKAKETLTDKRGEFFFPSYTTLIQPLSAEDYSKFIIYKPGYDTFPARGTMLAGLGLDGIETFFSKPIGSEGELEVMIKGGFFKKVKVKFGIAELPKVKTAEEWFNAQPSTPPDIRSKELPLLFKAINEERRRHGMEEIK
ncbi:MAG: carboxypeptidase-like regulatory domain-containing protein [Nitrospiraceae bacterium]|nr:carboxypeptidase-like regulatory domain-containing protein [Nitrospiraceae bacterium]